MSFAALAWAGKCKPGSASRKLVLLALADRHNDEVNGAYPSIAWIVEFTDLNRKTVINCLADLEALKFISDSGERRGDTKQIKLYRLHLDQEQHLPGETHYVYRLTDTVTGEFYVGVRSFLGEPEADSYKGSGKWPTGAAFRGNELRKEIIATFETRTEAEDAEAELIRTAMQHPLCKNIAKEFQKRDRKKTVPKTGNSTEKDAEQSQKRDTDTVRTGLPKKDKPSLGKRATRVPPDFLPIMTGKTKAVVDGWPPGRLEEEVEHFVDHHTSKGTLSFDWQASWRTWVKYSKKWSPTNGNRTGKNGQSNPQSPADAIFAARRNLGIDGGDMGFGAGIG